MISVRSIVLAALITLPVLIFAAVGGYAIWQHSSLNWIWWLMTVCCLAAWALSRVWKPRSPAADQSHEMPVASYWTPRDREAAEIVKAYQQAVDSHAPVELADPQFYLQQLQALGQDLAKFYHPTADDPLDQLTVPEVLAATRLAVDDLEQWMLESVPGSRLLTIRHWKILPTIPGWVGKASQAAWAASILLNPANIVRYVASKWSWQPVSEQLQSELLAVVYLRFMRQAGFYLIEMNSGRLRGGADAYRKSFGDRLFLAGADAKMMASLEPAPVTIAVVGQVSSGKSSLINLLTGTRDAAVDILPETRDVRRYQTEVGDPPVTITLLDTPGYGESGASRQQTRQIEQALQNSHAVLLVMDAHSPAREADRQTLSQLESYFASRPNWKPPPVIGVLTHIDLLPPALEWSPPYDWRQPDVPKAESLHDAVEYVEELFGNSLATAVPICSDDRENRTWGITEELLPALSEQLDDAHTASLLRAFEEQLDRERLQKVLQQLRRSGRALLNAWIDERLM